LLHNFLDLDYTETTRKKTAKMFDQPVIRGVQTVGAGMKSVSQWLYVFCASIWISDFLWSTTIFNHR